MFAERRSGVTLSRLLLLHLSNHFRRLNRVFGNEPFQYFQLVAPRSPASLNQKLLKRRPIQSQITCAFITDRTDRSQVRRFISAAHRLVYDVPDVKTGFPCRIGRMGFPGDCSAHLAGEAVAVQNEGPCLFRDATLKCRDRLRIQKKILAGLQVAPVIVGQDLVPFFCPQFSDPSSPLARVSGCFPQLVRLQYPSDIGKEVCSESCSGTLRIFGCHLLAINPLPGISGTQPGTPSDSLQPLVQRAEEKRYPPVDTSVFSSQQTAIRLENLGAEQPSGR